jgi:hypothetical protein
METSTALTLGQAARVSGVAKSTLASAIRRGTLSAARLDSGSYAIEPCELARAFPPGQSASVQPAQNGTAAVPDALLTELRARIAAVEADRDRWIEQAAHWREMAERLTSALPAPVAAHPAAPPPETPIPANAGSPLYRAWRWMRKAG